MRMYDGPRQIVAAVLGSLAFLGLYLGAAVVWWLALGLAVAVYGAALLLIGRRRPLEEIRLAARVSAADVTAAAEALEDARRRLDRARSQAPEALRDTLRDMAAHVAAIRTAVIEDPSDYRAARSFIEVYLPMIVQSVEGYVRLAAQATADSADRLARLADQIRGFVPVMSRIRTACIENDLAGLELEVNVLSKTLGRREPAKGASTA